MPLRAPRTVKCLLRESPSETCQPERKRFLRLAGAAGLGHGSNDRSSQGERTEFGGQSFAARRASEG